MAIEVYKLNGSEQIGVDRFDEGRAQVTYRVIGLPAQAAIISGNPASQIVGLVPNKGDAHPSNPAQFAVRLDARDLPNLSNACDIAVTYSTGTGGSFSKPPPDLTLNFATGMTFERIVTRIPFQVFAPRTVGVGDQAQTVEAWEIDPYEVEEEREVVQIKALLTTFGAGERAAIRSQVNKIHQIYGNKYLFRASPVAISQGPWEITYSWLSDPGTPAIAGAGNTLTPSDLGTTPPASAGLMREPFHRFGVIPSPDPTVTPHTITLQREYAEDLNGWQSLPGTFAV